MLCKVGGLAYARWDGLTRGFGPGPRFGKSPCGLALLGEYLEAIGLRKDVPIHFARNFLKLVFEPFAGFFCVSEK